MSHLYSDDYHELALLFIDLFFYSLFIIFILSSLNILRSLKWSKLSTLCKIYYCLCGKIKSILLYLFQIPSTKTDHHCFNMIILAYQIRHNTILISLYNFSFQIFELGFIVLTLYHIFSLKIHFVYILTS